MRDRLPVVAISQQILNLETYLTLQPPLVPTVQTFLSLTIPTPTGIGVSTLWMTWVVIREVLRVVGRS